MARNTQTNPQEQEGVRMAQPQEYTVTVNEHARTVSVEGDTFLFDNGSYTERHAFVSLVNKARNNALPEWVRQIPHLAEKIEAVFQKEREKGQDPFTRFSNSDGKLVVTDLRAGTSLAAPVADLKRLLQAGKPLPRAFASAQARRLIDLAA